MFEKCQFNGLAWVLSDQTYNGNDYAKRLDY